MKKRCSSCGKTKGWSEFRVRLERSDGYHGVCNGCEKLRSKERRSRPGWGSWTCMRERCLNKKNASYQDYGGRGVTVCERWSKFANFIKDMGPPPTPKHQIDRIDNNGNYEPGNCRWVTTGENNRNRRDTIFVQYDGKRIPLIEICETMNLHPAVVTGRLRLGWSLDMALSKPMKKDFKHYQRTHTRKKVG